MSLLFKVRREGVNVGGSGSIVFIPEDSQFEHLPSGYYLLSSAHVVGQLSGEPNSNFPPGTSYEFAKKIELSNPTLEADRGAEHDDQLKFRTLEFDQVYTSSQTEAALLPLSEEHLKELFGQNYRERARRFSAPLNTQNFSTAQNRTFLSTGWSVRNDGNNNLFRSPTGLTYYPDQVDGSGYFNGAFRTLQGRAMNPSSNLYDGIDIYSSPNSPAGMDKEKAREYGVFAAMVGGLSGGPIFSNSQVVGVNTGGFTWEKENGGNGEHYLTASPIYQLLTNPSLVATK